jgi:hypothetical protein
LAEKTATILETFFEVHRKDLYFSGRDIVALGVHFGLFWNSKAEAYKWFANFVLSNDLLVDNLRRKGVDETEMFSTVEVNTICISEIRAKTVSDAATEFIVNKLKGEFKEWGGRVVGRIEKSGIKLKDYVNSLRMSFLTSELPIEFTSIVLDWYILKGEYAFISLILHYLKLHWDEMRTIKNKGLTVTHLFKENALNLNKKEHIKAFKDLQGKYRSKLHLKNIFDIQIRMN